MKYRKIISCKIVWCTLLLLTVHITEAQNKNSYKENFVQGNYLVLEENYTEALKSFTRAYFIDSSNANINYSIGFCYLHLESQKNKALDFLLKAEGSISQKYVAFEPSEKNAPVNVYYYIGQAFHLNYKFDDAIAYYEKFKSFLSTKDETLSKEVDRKIEISKNAKEYIASPVKIKITNLGDSINTSYPEYSPLISADESMLIFTSRRPGSTGDMKTVDDQYFEDIYISNKKDGKWQAAVPIGTNINTSGHEASVGLSADGQQLYIYKDDQGDGNIYVSNLDGETWLAPVKLPGDVNSPSWEPSACMSADGNTIYFSSNRKEGFGGRDLYRCVRLPNGQWSKALNLGSQVNTEYDEDGPFIHPNNVSLFFSSGGHKSMGGFDIFYVNKTDSGWTSPVNMLPPINTTDDDIFYAISTDGRRAYYSSFKAEGMGEKDIYLITLEESPDVKPIALLIGKLTPESGTTLPTNLEIRVTDLQSSQTGMYKPNSKSGKYVLTMMPGVSYNISYMMGDVELYSEKITVPAAADYNDVQEAIMLDALTFKNNKIMPVNADSKKTTVQETPVTTTIPEKAINKQPDLIKETPAVKNEKDNIIYPDSVYKVVIGTVKNPAAPDAFKKVKNIEYEQLADGRYKYYTGTFNTYKEAKKFKEEIIQPKFKDAYITRFKGTLLPFDNKTKGFFKNEFEIYFKYNITEVSPGSADFISFISSIAESVNSKGKISLSMVSSASQVPTRAFKTNKELAEKRAETTKGLIINALKEKKVDVSKVIFDKPQILVGGPQYKDDYLISKDVYEKFQYIRIQIQ